MIIDPHMQEAVNYFIWLLYSLRSDGVMNLLYPPANCVCGMVYCFHVIRPSVRPNERKCVRNVLFP